MLIDATHHEETRVVVMEGNKLVEFDYESQVRRQIKGNIFLAKVTRVEPSLQAAFVNYGGNRHGFLPFAEIHPDYYRIPVSDREALLAEQAELEAAAAAREAEEENDGSWDGESSGQGHADFIDDDADQIVEEIGHHQGTAEAPSEQDDQAPMAQEMVADETGYVHDEIDLDEDRSSTTDPSEGDLNSEEIDDPSTDDDSSTALHSQGDETATDDDTESSSSGRRGWRGRKGPHTRGRYMGARRPRDEITEDGPASLHARFRRRYKIQEVIKRGQIMLIQVSKEERGNKGAAVTTYLSLPGRYCVLMPNSPRGGGVSRKIGNFSDRRRLKDMLKMLEIPSGMSVILRTAGVERTEAEIKRDYDYLLRLWNNIREMTLQSNAPALIYEEGDLIKRSIRDIYARDVDDLFVAGEQGYNEAREFMNMLMPSHVERVQHYTNDKIPLFQRYQVENQITEIGEPVVQLKSGGYIVINQTEALVAVDVNSGRATKERHIEETAVKTNLEAAEEIARQLRLRDLGGLVVIDFIDMEDRRNNAKVERRLKDALASDRARIQVSRISTFGLLELSRQRLNPSLTEAQFQKCPHCHGFGFIRSVDSAAILALRALEEEGVRARTNRVTLHIPNTLALYILNEKRTMLATIESRYGFKVMIHIDESLAPSGYLVEAMKQETPEDDLEDDGAEDSGDTPKPRGRKKPVDMEQALEDMPADISDADITGNQRDEDLDEDVNFNRTDIEPSGSNTRPPRHERGGRNNNRNNRRPQGNRDRTKPNDRPAGDKPMDTKPMGERNNDRNRGGRTRNGPRRHAADNAFTSNESSMRPNNAAGDPSDTPRTDRQPTPISAGPATSETATDTRPKATYFVAKRRRVDPENGGNVEHPSAPPPIAATTASTAASPQGDPNTPSTPPDSKKKGWWGR